MEAKIWMGFMDEEVSDILRFLIQRAYDEGRPVYVIERGTPKSFDTNLFERPIDDYKPVAHDNSKVNQKITVTAIDMNEGKIVGRFDYQGDKLNFITARNKQDKTAKGGNSKLFEKAGAIAKQFDSNLKRKRDNRDSPKEVKTRDGGLYLIKFKPLGKPEKEPYFLIRSPEMGLQPDLTRLYLRAIFKAIGAMGFTKLNISCFGAGGAVGEKLKPGDFHDVNGSFYVGITTKEKGSRIEKGNVFYGVVKFVFHKNTLNVKQEEICNIIKKISPDIITTENTYDFELKRTMAYNVDHMPTRVCKSINSLHDTGSLKLVQAEKAEKAAKEATDAAKKNFIKLITETETSCYIKKLVGLFGEYTINVTGSFFMGEDIKKPCGKVGIGEANMEDYHVLRVLNSLVMNKGEKYGNSGDALGMLQSATVTRVHCDPPDIPSDFINEFKSWVRNKGRFTLDQFKAAIIWGLNGCKIADLPKEAHWSFFDDYTGKNKKEYFYITEQSLLSKEGKKEFVLDPFFSEIASDFLTAVIKENAFPGIEEIETKKMKGYAENIKKGTDTEKNITSIFDAMKGCEKFKKESSSGTIRIWVRPDKWNKNTSVLINKVKWNGAAIDRALYKSTNQIVLQEMAEGRVSEALKKK